MSVISIPVITKLVNPVLVVVKVDRKLINIHNYMSLKGNKKLEYKIYCVSTF